MGIRTKDVQKVKFEKLNDINLQKHKSCSVSFCWNEKKSITLLILFI